MDILDVVKAFSESNVSVNALAHAQGKCPILVFEKNDGDVRGAIRITVFWRQPGDDRFVIGQETDCSFGTGGYAMAPYFPLENDRIQVGVYSFHCPNTQVAQRARCGYWRQ